MKDIPTEELAAISPEIHEAAVRVGCLHVAITGRIWPEGRLSGPPEEAARFVEFSWLRAAVINGRAIFEEDDAKAYSALLSRYGLGEDAYPEPAGEVPQPPGETPEPPLARTGAATVALSADILPATQRELERQATASGLSVGQFLDWKFQPPTHS